MGEDSHLRTDRIDIGGGEGRLGIGTNSPRPDVENYEQARDALDAATKRAINAGGPEEVEPDEELFEFELESGAELSDPLGRMSASPCSIRCRSLCPCRDLASEGSSALGR